VASVSRMATTDPRLAVTSAHWDQDPYLMGTPQGTLDLRTGLVRAPDAAEGISKLTALAPRRAPTPIWDRFLEQTFKGDADLIGFNQRWFGYGLTGDIREHALWFGSGSGGNGKGVMLNTITWLMGDYAKTAPMDMFTAKTHDSHPTDLAMLRGARLVTASETEEGRAWAESRIKQMTGGDPISARFMRQDFFTYQPQFKLSLIGNHNPRLHNVDDAVRRRFNLVPFLNKVLKEDQDMELEQKLRAEGAGIMQWLVDGCLAWQRGGLQTAAAVRKATEKYFSEQDLVGQWLAEFCEEVPGAITANADLFRSWALFAQAAGAEPGAQRQLTEALERRGFELSRTNKHGRCFKGLRVGKTTAEKPDLKSV
jgi:putative DNA primase/helicase